MLINIEADTIDTNADTNPHEQLRTRAMRQLAKYAYLQQFLNIGEQPRHHRSVIPLNRISRVRIPPPPLSFLLICRTNTETKEKVGTIPGLLYTTQYTNAA